MSKKFAFLPVICTVDFLMLGTSNTVLYNKKLLMIFRMLFNKLSLNAKRAKKSDNVNNANNII